SHSMLDHSAQHDDSSESQLPANTLPAKHGLYDPRNEKDSCGVSIVAHIKGKPSHQIVLDALTALRNMEHRGACGCEVNTGDGAGILTGIPYKFVSKVAKEELGVTLPEKGKFGTGLVFLPPDENDREKCKAAFNRVISRFGQKLLGWRR